MAAEAAAAAAMRELGKTLMASGAVPKLQTLQFLSELGLEDEEDALESDMINAVKSIIEEADGPAGDRVKYEYAVESMLRRWKLFVALHNFGEQEPTHEMVRLYMGFMYSFRQRSIKTGRQGLGDSMAEMAQYILAQVRARCAFADDSTDGVRWRARRALPLMAAMIARACADGVRACRRCSRRWATPDGSG